jgi:hypothetical protein
VAVRWSSCSSRRCAASGWASASSRSASASRRAGYTKLALWTNGALTAARCLYERAGIRRVPEEPVHSVGQDFVSETWELRL